MKQEAGDKRGHGKKQKDPVNVQAGLRKALSTLGPKPHAPDDGTDPDGMNEEDAWFLMEAVLSGELCRPTPFEEIAEDCPEVWSPRYKYSQATRKQHGRGWRLGRQSSMDVGLLR